MAIAPVSQLSPPLTYEEYLTEGESNRRYDIVNGRRVFMSSPTRGHQRILKNLTRSLLHFEQTSGYVQIYFAPMDVLIRKIPLQTRQPDLLAITSERLVRAGVTDETAALPVAPDLVVEVLSASDREQVLADKLADYASIGVQECWIVQPIAETVEVLVLQGSDFQSAVLYAQGEVVRSVVFPDLRVLVADVFTD